MATYDRKKHLKQIHESRKAITMSKVDEAIKRLVRANQEINFNSVASEAGVAKATLYNNVTLRERIETLRQQQIKRPSVKQVRHKMNENNKEVIIESLKRKVKRLEHENKDLRDQLKVAYAEVYKKI
jgi:predicted RNase H-like nuclease (RuvC/YqgF family)